MLKEFRVDNFKSLINIVFEPRQINLIIGKNNSGKTNLCQALQFVAASSVLKLDDCVSLIQSWRFGLTNFAFNKQTIDFYLRADVPFMHDVHTFEYELTISLPGFSISTNAFSGEESTIRVTREKLIVTGGKFDQTALLHHSNGRIRLLHEKDFIDGTENYVEASPPADTTMLQRLYDSDSNARANHFKRYLSTWCSYDLSPIAMRSSEHNPNEVVLARDGSNLASLLYRLKTSREWDYRQLLNVIKEVDPRLELINFEVFSNQVNMIFEYADRSAYPAWSASSGTLRFLALTYVLLMQPIVDTRPLLIIEEPENGIYVGLLKSLFELIEQSQGPQVVFTSHAPYFIDLFDQYLDAVFVLNRDEQHTSISQPNIDNLKARLEQFPLGEQHFRGLLG